MRKLIAFLTIVVLITSGLSNYSYAQATQGEGTAPVEEATVGDDVTPSEEVVQAVATVAEPEVQKSFH